MNFKEIITGIIIPIFSGLFGGAISSTIIIKANKQKQINKNNSKGIQIGEVNETTKSKR